MEEQIIRLLGSKDYVPANVPELLQLLRWPPNRQQELQRVLQAGVSFGAVVTDAGYGISAPFRQGLSALGLLWAVGIPKTQKVYVNTIHVGMTYKADEPKPLKPGAPSGTPSVKRTTATWIALLGFATMLMNLFGVNLFFAGLHSYANAG